LILQNGELSNGTVIGPDTILTHNHFDPGTGNLANETMTFTDVNGNANAFPMNNLDLNPIDGGTMLINMPDDLGVPQARLASQETINDLAQGNMLAATYWDDANNRYAAGNFRITAIANGVITLDDPNLIINPGDSGSGVYFNDELVGNIWSINADAEGNPLGSFNVALLPPQVVNRVR
jgi:V8-like Glu-specific endopeptidase